MNALISMMDEAGGFAYWALALGLAGNVCCLVLLMRSLGRPTRATALLGANVCLGVVALMIFVVWLGHRDANSAKATAMAGLASAEAVTASLRGHAAGTWIILLGFVMSALPLLGGVALLVRGFMLPGEAPARRPVANCIGLCGLWLGLALTCWAFASLTQFEAFRWSLLMCFW